MSFDLTLETVDNLLFIVLGILYWLQYFQYKKEIDKVEGVLKNLETKWTQYHVDYEAFYKNLSGQDKRVFIMASLLQGIVEEIAASSTDNKITFNIPKESSAFMRGEITHIIDGICSQSQDLPPLKIEFVEV